MAKGKRPGGRSAAERHRTRLRRKLALGEPADDIRERLSEAEEAFLARLKELDGYFPYSLELTGSTNQWSSAGEQHWLEWWHTLSNEDRLLAIRLSMNSTKSIGAAGKELLEKEKEARLLARDIRDAVASDGEDACGVSVTWDPDLRTFELHERSGRTVLSGSPRAWSIAEDLVEQERTNRLKRGNEDAPRWRGPWWPEAFKKGSQWRKTIARQHIDKFGIYRFIAVDPTGEPLTIPRLNGEDPTGTLYIGSASGVLGRFDDALATRPIAHDPARYTRHAGMWNLVNYGVLDKLGIAHGGTPEAANQIQLAWMTSPDWGKDEARREEARHLLAYRAVFGDLPPGNLSTGSKKSLLKASAHVVQEFTGRKPVSWYLPAR